MCPQEINTLLISESPKWGICNAVMLSDHVKVAILAEKYGMVAKNIIKEDAHHYLYFSFASENPLLTATLLKNGAPFDAIPSDGKGDAAIFCCIGGTFMLATDAIKKEYLVILLTLGKELFISKTLVNSRGETPLEMLKNVDPVNGALAELALRNPEILQKLERDAAHQRNQRDNSRQNGERQQKLRQEKTQGVSVTSQPADVARTGLFSSLKSALNHCFASDDSKRTEETQLLLKKTQ